MSSTGFLLQSKKTWGYKMFFANKNILKCNHNSSFTGFKELAFCSVESKRFSAVLGHGLAGFGLRSERAETEIKKMVYFLSAPWLHSQSGNIWHEHFFYCSGHKQSSRFMPHRNSAGFTSPRCELLTPPPPLRRLHSRMLRHLLGE